MGHVLGLRSTIFLVAFFCARAGAAWAQLASTVAPLRGCVLEDGTGKPVAGALVVVEEVGLHQYSDSLGRFEFSSVPVGRRVITTKRLGYKPTRDTLMVSIGDTVTHRLLARRTSVSLSAITIAGRSYRYPPFFDNAYKRAAAGRGTFFTKEDIDQLTALDYETLFNRVPGVSANSRGVTFSRCQTGLEGARSRKLTPKVQVWIDGIRMANSGDTTNVYQMLGSVKPHMIQIMEVYPSLSSIPAEFFADACAVIVIWTKRD